jgi:hypothetical protein
MTYCGVRIRGWLTAIKTCQGYLLAIVNGIFFLSLNPVLFKMLFSALFSVAAPLVAETSAHGAVTSYVIDGTAYPEHAFFSTSAKTQELS